MEIKKKLLDIVRDKIRVKHYSISTERTYVHWIKHYILFHNKKHPIEMAKPEMETFLTLHPLRSISTFITLDNHKSLESLGSGVYPLLNEQWQ